MQPSTSSTKTELPKEILPEVPKEKKPISEEEALQRRMKAVYEDYLYDIDHDY